jgi:hypothetical protein
LADDIFVSPTPATDAWSLYEEKRKREANTTPGNYLGAMWRQDSPVDGVVAHVAGSQMAPDPRYSVFEPKAWQAATQGIPEEFHKEFHQATSAAHAEYIRGRLMDKFDDQQKLGDLGFAGNTGRVLFGLVEPTTLLAGVASGGIFTAARGVQGVVGASRALNTARKAGEVGAAADAAGQVASVAARESRAPALVASVTGGAGFNAAFEKVRQSVSFENDNAQVLEAALTGAAFAAPFVALRGREMSKLAKSADMEKRVLNVVRKERDGVPLDEHDVATVHEYKDSLKHIEDIESGKVRAEEVPSTEATNPQAITPERAAAIKKAAAATSAKRAAEFDKARAAADLPKQQEMDALWADGHMAKGEEAQRVGDILDTVNADTKGKPTAMELAFAKAHLKKADAASRPAPLLDSLKPPAPSPTEPQGIAPGASPAAAKVVPEPAKVDAGDHMGTEVFWRDAGGNVDGGVVVGKNAKGSLKVDLFAGLDPMVKPASGQRYKWMRPESLDMDSPLYRDIDIPEGFMPEGSIGAGQIAPIQKSPLSPDYEELTHGSAMRGDIFAVLNKSKNPVVQELGHLLVKDAIGNSDSWAQKWTASEIKKHIWRMQAGHFHTEARDAFDEVRAIRGLGPIDAMKAHQEFYENITHLTRNDQQVLVNNPDIVGPLNKASAAMKQVYRELAVRAQKSGLEGAEGLVPNDAYVNRVWNHNNIRTAIQRMDEIYGKGNGRAELDRVLAGAIPYFRNDAAKAHSFLNAVRKLEFSHVLQDIQLMGRDMAALRAELNKHLTPTEVDSIVDIMFAAKKAEPDAGNPTNLRYRLDLDENYRETLKDGSEFRVSDMFENDSRLLVDKYINSMGGQIAMAEKGITSRAVFDRKIKDAMEHHEGNLQDTVDASTVNRELQLAKDMYDHVTGKPMSTQSFNRFDRFMGAFRSYTRSTFLGQLGIAAAFETKNAIGLATVRAFWQQMPGFRGFIQAVRSGRIANAELATDIESMWAFGMERAAAYARQHEITEYTYDRGLSKFENYANKASHAVDIISGNAHFTSATRQMTAAMMIQKHANLAHGSMKLNDKIRERMVHQGLNETEITTVLDQLKQHSTVDSKGRVKELQWEQWQQDHPKSYDSYTLLVEREVRDAIQDHDIGETFPFMHTTLGKIASELRTFNLAAHSKQFLKGLHYHDGTTAMTWTLSFMGEALAYSVQTSINFAHNQQELDKRLSLERIAQAVVQRMSVLGVAPMLLETGFFVGSGGSSLFKNGGTTNTDNRNLFLTPSIAAANRLLKGASVGAGALNPLSSNITTQQDMKALLGTLPGGNTWVMRNINDYVSSQYPKKELQQGR